MEKIKVGGTAFQPALKPNRQYLNEQKQLRKDARPTKEQLHQAAVEQKKNERLRAFGHDNVDDWLNRMQNDPEFRANRIGNMDKAAKLLAVFFAFLEIMRSNYPVQSMIPFVEAFVGMLLVGAGTFSIALRINLSK